VIEFERNLVRLASLPPHQILQREVLLVSRLQEEHHHLREDVLLLLFGEDQ
jgi:hypothetical protein